jgi:ribose transport system substrate-binding protein
MGKQVRLVPIAAVALALFAAGCGSDDDSTDASNGSGGNSSADVAQIEETVEQLKQRPTELPEQTPIAGEVPKGKVIDYMQCGVPSCAKLGEYLKEAADVVGWKVNIVNLGLTPEDVKAAFDKAVRDQPDAVVTTGGFDRAIYGKELAQLKKDGIPLIAHSEGLPAAPEEGVTAVESGPNRHEEIGTAWADWAIADSGGEAKVLFIDSGFPVQGLQKKALEARLAEACDGCEFSAYQAPLASINKDLAGKIAQQLQKAPDTTHLVVGFGDMATGLPAALAGAGITDVKIATQEQADANIEDMRNGKIDLFHVGSGPESMWNITDTLIRYFNEEEFPAETKLPRWLVTQETVPEGVSWPSVDDYQAQYKERWGLN